MSVNFGDFITLSSDGGYMHAQALVLTRLGVRYANGGELPSRFHEHIFRICPALRYEAQDSERARRTLARSNSMSVKETKELAEAEVVERTKNAAVLAQLDAAPTSDLYYGSTIQLLHVYSGKFISGKRATAEVQKENLLLTLEQQGSSDSAFIVKPRCDPLPSARATHGGGSPSQDPASRSVSPFPTRALACPPLARPSHLHTHAPCAPLGARASNALARAVPLCGRAGSYNYRTEGDYVYFDDEIVLESVTFAPQSVCPSSAAFNNLEPDLCEVSLVEQSSGWSIGRFTRLKPREAREFLTAGASLNVRFWHCDVHGYLTASANAAKAALPYIRRAHNDDVHDVANHTSKSLWSFEFATSAARGGALLWAPRGATDVVGVGANGGSAVRLRHVATGRYLAVTPTDRRSPALLNEIGAGKPDGGAEFDLTLLDTPDSRAEARLVSFLFLSLYSFCLPSRKLAVSVTNMGVSFARVLAPPDHRPARPAHQHGRLLDPHRAPLRAPRRRQVHRFEHRKPPRHKLLVSPAERYA